MRAIRIPVYKPRLEGNERAYVNECLDSTWISSKGPFIERFEQAFAAYVGTRFAASVSNGTVALHVALLSLGIGPGDEVIVPTLTYVATANAVAYTGAKPVFVDSVASTWQMDPADVEAKITSRTRAVLAVHLYGYPAPMDALSDVCLRHGLTLVEDCAEAIGTRFGSQSVGTFGAVSSFSFFGNKTITTGEGGMVTTDDPELIRRIRKIKGQGLADNREYWHDVLGYNYRMTNICAAIGLAQLETVATTLAAKEAIARHYREMLADLPLTFQPETPSIFNSHWMVSCLTPNAGERDTLREHLASRGVETRPLFFPIHGMPMYAQAGETHPVAEALAARGLNLPSWPGLAREDIAYVCFGIKEFFERTRKTTARSAA